QGVNDVEVSVLYALAFGEALGILGVTRGRVAGAVQTQQGSRHVVEAVAPRDRRRVRVAEFLEDWQRLLVSFLLKERAAYAEVCGRDVSVHRVTLDERAPVSACLLEGAVGLIDRGAAHVLLRRELRERAAFGAARLVRASSRVERVLGLVFGREHDRLGRLGRETG